MISSLSKVKVTLICAATACGRIAPVPVAGPADRARLEAARRRTDASLVGAGTVRAADPEMRCPGGVLPGERMRAIVTASGDIHPEGKALFSHGPPPLIFTTEGKAPLLAKRFRERARVMPAKAGPLGVSIADVIGQMVRLGARNILVEGGAGLNYSALREGIVDEILLTIAPRMLGKAGVPSVADGPGFLGVPFLGLRLEGLQTSPEGEVFLTYGVRTKRMDT